MKNVVSYFCHITGKILIKPTVPEYVAALEQYSKAVAIEKHYESIIENMCQTLVNSGKYVSRKNILSTLAADIGRKHTKRKRSADIAKEFIIYFVGELCKLCKVHAPRLVTGDSSQFLIALPEFTVSCKDSFVLSLVSGKDKESNVLQIASDHNQKALTEIARLTAELEEARSRIRELESKQPMDLLDILNNSRPE
jgi:hypothetical protein